MSELLPQPDHPLAPEPKVYLQASTLTLCYSHNTRGIVKFVFVKKYSLVPYT